MVIKTANPLDDKFIIKAINKKLSENHRLQRLQDYYEGRQDISLRVQSDRDKPNNKITVNYCKDIADFLTSYLVGVPVKYEAPQIILDNLNYNDNDDVTQEIVLNMNIHGFGAELFYTDAEGIARFTSIDPREAIFVTNDTLEELIVAFIRVYPKIDEGEGYNVTVYTDEQIAEYALSMSVGELKATGEAMPHFFGDVPAILYANNKEYIGAFEGVMTLQDALNQLMSDTLNDWEAFVDAYLVLTGLQATQADDIAKMKKDRILLMDGEAKAEWLIKNVNNDHVKELKDSLTRKIRDLGSVPDLEQLGSFGASGVALRFKLLKSEICASKQERVVYKGIQRKLELLYNILRIIDPKMGNYTDVKISFERNFVMLNDDKLNNMKADLKLVTTGLMSRERFLIKYEDMTSEEVIEELKKVTTENRERGGGSPETIMPK